MSSNALTGSSTWGRKVAPAGEPSWQPVRRKMWLWQGPATGQFLAELVDTVSVKPTKKVTVPSIPRPACSSQEYDRQEAAAKKSTAKRRQLKDDS